MIPQHPHLAILTSAKLILISFCLTFSAITANAHLDVLVFAQKDQWHKDTLVPARKAFEALATQNHFYLEWTEDPHFFSNPHFQKKDVIVFLHGKIDRFTDAEKRAFQQHMKEKGGFVGIHATITHGEWDWFHQLVGREFIFHPHQQSAKIQVLQPNHPSASHFPSHWTWYDEFYVFSTASRPDSLQTVLAADTTSYDAIGEHLSKLGQCDPIAKHIPLAWHHKYGGGRAFYTALGHRPEHYKDPQFIQHILGAIQWAASTQ